MRSIRRTVVLVALVVGVLATAASGANAAIGFSISPAGSIAMTSLGSLTWSAWEYSLTCRYRWSGTLPTTLRNIEATLGEVTHVEWSACTGGEWAAVLNLPWPMTITALNGIVVSRAPAESLRSIRIKIAKTAFQLATFGGIVDCLWGSSTSTIELEGPLTKVEGTRSSYTVGLLRLLPNSLPLQSGFGCPSSQSLSGTFAPFSPTQTIKFR